MCGSRLRGGKIVALDGLYMKHENQIPVVVVSPFLEAETGNDDALLSYPGEEKEVADEGGQGLEAWSFMREEDEQRTFAATDTMVIRRL